MNELLIEAYKFIERIGTDDCNKVTFCRDASRWLDRYDATEKVEVQNTDNQQLKAKIAAIADIVHSANYGSGTITLKEIESKLRQLSAV